MTDREKEPRPLASPACNAGEASDTYMGFASREEIAAFLAEIAADSRAGRPVADKLRRMLPRIRDDGLHADLSARLAALPDDAKSG